MNLFGRSNKGNFAKGIAMGMIAGGLIGVSSVILTDSDRMKDMKRMADKCMKRTKAAISNISMH